MNDKSILTEQIEYRDIQSQQVNISTVEDVQNLVQQNLEQFKADDAEYFASLLVEQQPQYARGYIFLAITNLNKGRYAQAIKMAESAFSLGAKNNELFITASIAYRENGQLEDALNIIEEAALLYPTGPRIQRELSVCKNLQNPTIAAPKTAIVATIIDVEKTIKSFIEYHLSIGIDHLFLFFDDPNEASISIALKYPQVSVIKNDQQLKSAWKQLPGFKYFGEQTNTQPMARQLLNVQIANRLCLKNGIDWLIHIDADEAFYCPHESVKQHFTSLHNRDIYNVRYLNHEAIPTSLEVGDFFKKVTLFKSNPNSQSSPSKQHSMYFEQAAKMPKLGFLYYGNGKSAARVSPKLAARGVHDFTKADPLRFDYMGGKDAAFILHYPCCGFEQFWTKYQTLGDFSDKWLGGADISETIGPFHTDSRNIVAAGDRELAKEFYKQRAMISDQKLIENLIDQGLLIRINKLQNTLKN